MKDLDAEKKSNVPTGSNSLLIGTDSKADSTGLGTGEDGVLVVEPNEDSSKSWGIKSKTEDAVAEEKKCLAMDDNGKSAHIMNDLADRHLQSVVCLKVWWRDWSTEGRRPIMPRATGSIIYSSQESMLILSCSTIFRNFTTCFGPAFDTIEILNENIFLQVDFFDGHSAMGMVYCISWWKDLCLVLIPFPERTYEPVKFIDDENLMDQSIYKRGTKVFSIFCIPNGQKILFGTTSNGKICGLPIIGNDLGPVYDPDLEFFEFTMPGGKECPGRPVFTDNLLVMGICTCRFDKLEFALTLDQIRRWLHDCFDIEMTSSMNKTVARLSRIISKLPVPISPTPHSPWQGLYPVRHQDHLCPSQLTAQACPDAPLLPEAAKLVPKWLTMDDDRKSARIMCELADKHLESVISLKVQWKYSSKEGRKPMRSYGTGSIIHSSKKFILILSSSKALRAFTTRPGPDFNSVGMLNENIILRVDFLDGHSAKGEVYCVDWWKDLCLVFVPYPKKSYVPVKFIDNEDLMGQSFYKRATEVFSIFCFPTCQKDDKVLFGTTINGKICGGPVIGKDLDPVYAPDLEFLSLICRGHWDVMGHLYSMRAI
ncbi:uncharacterized protein LOC119337494 [Triticum dicoccoides]|uniref:uncharacterized protein LOC119337494 n=1 Tax=Triticum dicoccoides TaxID=85692 RepID=UPI001891634C|nr:uncharacterized protein LOC119337494 [Triticum dicoccoides]